MQLIPSFLRRKAASSPEANAADAGVTLQNPGWLSQWGTGGVPLFGGAVSEDLAMAVAAVYRCVTLISSTIASLDLGIYTDDPKLGQVVVPTKLNRLLQVTPYPGRAMTSFVLKEALVMNLLLHGNAYAAIRYDQAGRVVALEHIPPWLVRPVRINHRNVYIVTWIDGRAVETIDFENILHVPGPGYDGFTGMSRIRQNARNTIAMARSLEEVHGKALDNSMAPKSVLKMPPGASPESVKRLEAFMNNEFSGRSQIGRTLMLDAGTEYSALQINVVDLAILDAMKTNITQIAMFFGVPPLLLGVDQTTSFGTGISSLLIAFLRFGLNSDLERIEAEITAKLCSPGQYAWFSRDQLLQMDAASAADVAAKEISCGISTVNEVRARQHRPLVEGGDVPLTNSTNIPLTEAIQPGRVIPPAQGAAQS